LSEEGYKYLESLNIKDNVIAWKQIFDLFKKELMSKVEEA
jgi:hypothetical protein